LIDIDLYDRMLVIVSNISSLDLSEFIKDCEPRIDENREFLKRCEIYFSNFHGTFEHMIEECLSEILPLDQQQEYTNKLKRIQEKYRNNIDIVLAFSDSYGIVLDLKKSIEKTGMLNDLADHLNESIAKRLLIPGVITHTILNQYINMLKILQILDPNGVIFDKIAAPIKNYLLHRNDTLRCIISHLTEDV
jgi:DNA repair exonuclease SbcCD ATPase subunit